MPTALEGAFIIEPELLTDERGSFARSYCRDEFLAQGLDPAVDQCNISFNKRRGTLRGLHYQASPHEEAKLVRCTQGAIWDVIVDLREHSPTRFQWFAAELNADNRRALYIPRGLAHGFQTLSDYAEVFYQMSGTYHPESARGVCWDDPTLGINWPVENPVLSERDRTYPPLKLSKP